MHNKAGLIPAKVRHEQMPVDRLVRSSINEILRIVLDSFFDDARCHLSTTKHADVGNLWEQATAS